jgi:hypothetical protein
VGFITPEMVAAKAVKAYPKFLAEWIRGEGEAFFPYRVRAPLAVDQNDWPQTKRSIELLVASSKAERGWGYTLHREQVRLRDFGTNLVPKQITIDTLDDLLRLAKCADQFEATRRVVEKVRAELPQLNDWLMRNVRTLHVLDSVIEGLTAVAQYFLTSPWPDCYARQIPVKMDTKFIEQNARVLREWLDLLLPASAIDVNETKFARRFGLRDGQPHRAIRLLDPELAEPLGLPFDELSLPLRSIAQLPMRDALVIIVENDLNLLTLPPVDRGIALRGEGDAVNRLETIPWLETNRVYYWGDIDVEGFAILSRLRKVYPHVESVLMDMATLEAHQQWTVPGTGTSPPLLTNLSPSELSTYEYCAVNNCRLEQEKILQAHVDAAFSLARVTSLADR